MPAVAGAQGGIMQLRKTFAAFLVAVLALGLAGCVSLKSVQDYSTASRKTLEGVQAVGKDYNDSCVRKEQYAYPLKNSGECEELKKAGQAVKAAATVLNAYFAALGALAADELVDYSKDLNALSKEVKDAKIMTEAQAGAVEKAAGLVAKALTSLYQQKQVATYLNEGNASLVNAANGLADVVEKSYGHVLHSEQNVWQTSLDTVTAQIKPGIELKTYVAAQWQLRTDLEAKRSAAVALAKALREMSATHEKLTKDSKDLTGKEVYAATRAFVDSALPVIQEVQTAYGGK
jgi:hypothetical protein